MAAPVLLASGLNDLVATTLRNLGKPDITEIATDLQEHTAMSELLNKNRVVLTGYGVQWDVMVDHARSAANVGLGASDTVNIVDTTVQATADWRNTTANYAIIGQEVDMNSEPERIVNLVKLRRMACMISLAELMESNFWGAPVAFTDNTTPWGINTWIVKNATEGFNGGAPSGYTSIGLNPTTYPRWKNWTFQYTTVSKDDLVRKWRKAATFCNFKPAVSPSMPGLPNSGNKWSYYTNYAVIGPLEEALQGQNENLGTDIAKYDGDLMFRRVNVKWVPKLEADTTNPVYGLNWNDLKTYILRNWWLRETNIPNYPGQHTISAHFLDSTYQWIFKNRRGSFVGATGTSYPA